MRPAIQSGLFPKRRLDRTKSVPVVALKILDTCVNCDVCEVACPNQAISLGEDFYVIDPARCTECVGHHDEPQCIEVCPVECILPDPAYQESEAQLREKYRRLTAETAALESEQA